MGVIKNRPKTSPMQQIFAARCLWFLLFLLVQDNQTQGKQHAQTINIGSALKTMGTAESSQHCTVEIKYVDGSSPKAVYLHSRANKLSFKATFDQSTATWNVIIEVPKCTPNQEYNVHIVDKYETTATTGETPSASLAIVIVVEDDELPLSRRALRRSTSTTPIQEPKQSNSCAPLVINGQNYTFEECLSFTNALNLPCPYELYYTLSPSPTGTTILKGAINATPKEGWVGLGFPVPPSTGMLNSRAIIVSPNTNSPTGAIVDGYILRDYTPEAVNGAKGQFRLTDTAAEKKADGTLLAAFTAELADVYTTITTTPRNVIYAVGTIGANNLLQPHIVSNQADHPYGQARIQFKSGESTNGTADNNNDTSDLVATSSSANTAYLYAHAWLMGIGWGLLIPLGAVIAHGFKEYDPLWFKLHRAIQVLGLLMGFTGLGLVLKYTSDKYSGNPKYSTWNIQYPTHRDIGITVLSLGLVQATALVFRPHIGTKLRPYWHAGHAFFGVSAIALAIANVFYGLYRMPNVVNPETWSKVLYIVFICLIGALVLAKEVYNFFKKPAAKSKTSGTKIGNGQSVSARDTSTSEGAFTKSVC